MSKLKVELIEKFMKDNNLTKKIFCQKCKISRKTLDSIFEGNMNMRTRTFLKLVKFLGVGCDELLGIDDKTNEEKRLIERYVSDLKN
ncbi:MAG: helix-turn-helix transcriptional regulator [Clostridia bacterium]|nr:helix-turn-helix transcriptional regulator [Clostridia bacterium]